jgi:hypothetical protein
MDSKTLVNALKTAVREVIKEELTDILKEGLQSTINEMSSAQTAQPKKTPTRSPKKVRFNENKWSSVLNDTDSLREQGSVASYADLMNEEMETMSFTSRNAQGFGMQRQAAPQIMEDPESGKNMKVDPVVAKAMTRDYSALMKAIDKKKGK